MNKKTASYLAVLIIIIFIGYIIIDTAIPDRLPKTEPGAVTSEKELDKWINSQIFDPQSGPLKAVTVSESGDVYLGGDSFIACYDKDLKSKWKLKTSKAVTALSISEDTVYASTIETILILNKAGLLLDEWGPYEDNAIITSVSSNKSLIVFADAGNKIVLVLNRKGEVETMIGKTGEPFILPSPYFDAALAFDNTLYIANTGNRRIETRKTDGTLVRYFGLPGTAPDSFSGCCNPAHFALIPGGFVTAEKGINRIKILDEKGKFVEFVSSVNKFIASIPLDLASADGKTIYAANPADGKLYVFIRK
jgi:outer membrane protein assembly factor BamB